MRVQRFEDLEVFQRSYKISLEIHAVSIEFPKIEQYELAKQMRRASKSIPANIAEGYGKRRSRAEFRRYLLISLGSTDEMRVWLRYCLDLHYLSNGQWQNWKDEYTRIAKMLNRLVRILS